MLGNTLGLPTLQNPALTAALLQINQAQQVDYLNSFSEAHSNK